MFLHKTINGKVSTTFSIFYIITKISFDLLLIAMKKEIRIIIIILYITAFLYRILMKTKQKIIILYKEKL